MTIGWGFIGTGNYPSSRMAPAAALAEGTSIVACFSRDQSRADEFANIHGALAAYTSVDEMLADSRVLPILLLDGMPVLLPTGAAAAGCLPPPSTGPATAA